VLTDPLTLFDQTIDNLEILAAILADEIDERIQRQQLEQGVAIHRVAHGKIGLLLPILRAARMAQENMARATRPPNCIHCD
jgi:hypothetical protein